MIRQRKLVIAPLIFLALLTTACPASSDLDRMAKASNELAHDVVLSNKVVAEFFNAGKIPLTKKDIIANKLGIIGDKGKAFNDFLIQLDAKYPQGTIPAQDLAFVRQNLQELRQLYSSVLADLLPFGAQGAVTKLDTHLKSIEKVVQ